MDNMDENFNSTSISNDYQHKPFHLEHNCVSVPSQRDQRLVRSSLMSRAGGNLSVLILTDYLQVVKGQRDRKSVAQTCGCWAARVTGPDRAASLDTCFFPRREGATVWVEKRSCHKTAVECVSVCERESECMNKKVCCVSPLQ